MTKYFGMYVYIDKYDYTVNNLNTGEIGDEIEEIETKLEDIEISNIDYFDRYVIIIKNYIDLRV